MRNNEGFRGDIMHSLKNGIIKRGKSNKTGRHDACKRCL